jgi:hypothetical protein
VHFSQTGQLADIVHSLLAPLRACEEIQVHEEILRPVHPYPFPWSFFTFLDVFPESVRLDPAPIEQPAIPADESFDLIILAYQVWYLSPSSPITAFLTSASGRRLIAGKPVMTVVACRNMWLVAQQTVKRLLQETGAKLIDHVAFVDRANVLATLITTPRWLLTGRREGFFGLPRAGVASSDITGAARFGRALVDALLDGREQSEQPMLCGLRAVSVDPSLLVSERAGQRVFGVWAGLIRLFGKPGQLRRRPVLLLFVIYLVSAIILVVPLSLALQWLFAPLLKNRMKAMKAEHEQPSGSEDFKMTQYEMSSSKI